MSRSLVATIARKELREIVRDGRLRVLVVLVVILGAAALAFGVQQTLRAQHAREHAQERATDQWQTQGDKNPHVAAHYGTHVFAPTSTATAIDPGVSAFLGQSVKVEAHRRNLASHSRAQDGAGVQGLGAFSVASVLLLLVPLLIIAIGYGAWSRERERGTLRQLLSTGVDRKTLLWGKGAALLVVLFALLTPAAAAIIGVLWWLGGGDGDTMLRLASLGIGYGVYFATIAGLTLYVSAAARSSRAALVALVAVWGVFCLAMPRVASEAAAVIAPLPSRAEVGRAVHSSLANGLDGKTPREKGIEAITVELMKKEGLSGTGMLVAGSFMAGLELQAEAQWEDRVYDHHIRALDAKIAAQERAVAWFGVLSPYVAMRALSAGLCGTDYHHHSRFTEAAEAWRKGLVGQLNEAFAKKGGAKGWDYKAGPDLWQKVPPFSYSAPAIAQAAATHLVSIVALLLWLVVAIGLALASARRVRVV